MKKINKNVIITIIAIVLFILGIVALTNYTENKLIEKVQNELPSILEQCGFQDVSVSVKKYKEHSEYIDYEVDVSCSNLDSMSVDELVDLSWEMDPIIEKYQQEIDRKLYMEYECNGNEYSLGMYLIYKNGKTIYSDTGRGDYIVSTDDKSEITESEKGTCWALAKDVVKQNLKSPSSAKFPTYGASGVSFSKSGNTYTVKGYVDADNSFGANIRSNFTVTMEKSGYGSSAKFTAKSCIID